MMPTKPSKKALSAGSANKAFRRRPFGFVSSRGQVGKAEKLSGGNLLTWTPARDWGHRAGVRLRD